MTYNILEVEDKIKGLPDQALMKEAQFPSGGVPQFLIVSELQRRNEMRKSYAATQDSAPTVPVAQQVVAEASQGVAGMMGGNPMPPPPMQAQVPMQAQAPMPMQPPMPPPMQAPMPAPMQPPMPRPQAPAGIVGMEAGRNVPALRGASNQVAAVNAAIESLKSEGRDVSVYSQGELRRMGEEILGTNTVPSLVSQGYREFRPDLGGTYELETQGTSIFDPLARPKVGDLFSGVTDPVISAAAKTGEVAQGLTRDAASGVADLAGKLTVPQGESFENYSIDDYLQDMGIPRPTEEQRARFPDSNPYVGRDMVAGTLDFLGGVGSYLTGAFGSEGKKRELEEKRRAELAVQYPDLGYNEINRLLQYEIGMAAVNLPAEETNESTLEVALDQMPNSSEQVQANEVVSTTNDSLPSQSNEIDINQSALMGSQMGSQGKYLFNLPFSNRALTTDISKLVDKEMSVDGMMSGLNLLAGDLPEIPTGADFTAIAEARANRGEAATTRVEELIESIQSKAKNDAINMALINIGAGVAGGDLSGGLDKAGEIAGKIGSDARKSVQALELQGITMAEEAARSGEDIQIQEALSDLQRFSVEQGIAKDQRDYNLEIIKTKANTDLNFRKLTNDLAQSENISRRSVLSLISDIIKEEGDNAALTGETFNAGERALQLYNPIGGLFGFDALSGDELNQAREQIGATLTSTSDDSAYSINMRLPD